MLAGCWICPSHREREPIECADVLAFFLEIQRLAYFITVVTD
jgi:hypothetical protein